MSLVRGLDEDAAPVHLRVTTLADYVLARDPDAPGLPVVRGELRSHARANILPGVISVRGHLKRAMAQAERTVERYAEPLSALWSPRSPDRYLDSYLDSYLDMAWQRLVDASCHDSVTGCGVDETAVQVAARLAEAERLGQAVRDEVLARLAPDVPAGCHLVVNPSARRRTALVEIDVAAPDEDRPAVVAPDGTALPVQELFREPVLLGHEVVDATDLPMVLARIHGRELFGQPGLVDVDVDPVDLGASTPRPVRVGAGRYLDNGVLDNGALDNGDVRVEVEPAGTLTVQGADGTVLHGVVRLVDGGDRGDSYNYAPPARDRLVDEPARTSLEVLEDGPLRGVLEVVREYDWPDSLVAGDPDSRSDATVRVPVRTLVELRQDEAFVRLHVTFTNPCADHRLRLHVPLPCPVERSHAEGQFAVTERGLESEGGCGEHPLPTFPAAAFVAAGDAVVLLDEVTEYELAVGGAELALTLLRSIGRLSVNVHPLRDEPAGPALPVPQAQRVGDVVEARLAVLPHAGGWAAAGAIEAAEDFRHGFVTRAGTAAVAAQLPPPSAGLDVAGVGVVMTSLRRRDTKLELRLVAMTETPALAVLTGPFAAARRVDLLGRPLDGTPGGAGLPGGAGHVEIAMAPWGIATVRLTR